MASKLSERVRIYPAGVWVDASKFRQFMGFGYVEAADGGESVTVQLRKATDSAGSGATNFGTAVTTTRAGSSPAADDLIVAAQDGRADELGETGGGVQYTHVSVQITGDASPETAAGVLVCGDARFSDDYLAGAGFAGL